MVDGYMASGRGRDASPVDASGWHWAWLDVGLDVSLSQ